jgi:hypothetical protein
MASKFDQEIFKGKTFSNLLEDIYKDTHKKAKTIETLIKELSAQIDNPGTALVIVPLISEYLEMDIKNSDNLIKMAGIVQRFLNSTTGSDSEDGGILSQKEREQLFKSVEDLKGKAAEIEDRA